MALILLFGLGACAHREEYLRPFVLEGFHAGDRLTQEQAIGIAAAEAKRREIDLARYKSPETFHSENSWLITWWPLGNGPFPFGDEFTILVHEDTKTVSYSPGR
jgi:hypothetical protein